MKKKSFIICLNSLISGTVSLGFSTTWESGFENRGYRCAHSSTYRVFPGRKSGEILFESLPDQRGWRAGRQTDIWSLLRWSRDRGVDVNVVQPTGLKMKQNFHLSSVSEGQLARPDHRAESSKATSRGQGGAQHRLLPFLEPIGPAAAHVCYTKPFWLFI